jgi:hypothetical protein
MANMLDENLLVHMVMNLSDRVTRLEKLLGRPAPLHESSDEEEREEEPATTPAKTWPKPPTFVSREIMRAHPHHKADDSLLTAQVPKAGTLAKGATRRNCLLEDQTLIVKLYGKNVSVPEITKITGWSCQTILNQLRNAGVPIRKGRRGPGANNYRGKTSKEVLEMREKEKQLQEDVSNFEN